LPPQGLKKGKAVNSVAKIAEATDVAILCPLTTLEEFKGSLQLCIDQTAKLRVSNAPLSYSSQPAKNSPAASCEQRLNTAPNKNGQGSLSL
jgi:hypothetical protein